MGTVDTIVRRYVTGGAKLLRENWRSRNCSATIETGVNFAESKFETIERDWMDEARVLEKRARALLRKIEGEANAGGSMVISLATTGL